MSKPVIGPGVEYLLIQVERVLRAHPIGLSEYRLIEQLDQLGVNGFDKGLFSSSLSMFQAHFILFHLLYVLRDRLRQQGDEDLEIHCLNIRVFDSHSGGAQSLVEFGHEPLRDYYLDLDNLHQTDKTAVDALLSQFWRQYIRGDERQAALACLNLSEPVSAGEIKRHYRRLVMEHHPDRGGDTTRLQDVNEAMAILERC